MQHPPSFREALLNIPGLTDDCVSLEGNWEEETLQEDRWYKDVEDFPNDQLSGSRGMPEILVTDKELEDWSQQWDQTLIINVMGKRITFRALENKLKRDWARAGPIQIIDLPRGYFAVKFDSLEDYHHALFEGPWMIADHYILVQR